MFREESEGYAKLITELNQEPFEYASAGKLLEVIKSLIGCFNLDPNRVLDIILESFETRPEQHRLFIDLLKSYMPNGNVVCEILGYKYRYFSDTKTPQSLYTITALLLQSSIIRLDDIYTWVCAINICLLFIRISARLKFRWVLGQLRLVGHLRASMRPSRGPRFPKNAYISLPFLLSPATPASRASPSIRH